MGELSILPAPAAPVPRRRNYLVRRWRGELSLPVSYWVNGALVSVAGTVLGLRAQRTMPDLNDPRRVLALGIALVVISLLLPVWQFVGVWRSAGQHEERGGRRFWAVAARVMVAVRVLRFAVFSIQHVAPEIPIFYVMAVGDRDMKHEVRLLGERDALFSGEIGFGATADIETLLDAHPPSPSCICRALAAACSRRGTSTTRSAAAASPPCRWRSAPPPAPWRSWAARSA